MSRYILHLAQVHETFRKPELEALAALFKLDLKFLQYSENVSLDECKPPF